MPMIRWKDSYSVNNQQVDEQHQQWISIFNKMHSTLIYGPPMHATEAGREAMKEMVNYTQYHFRYEEDYLKSIGYPEIVEHCKLHRDFDDLICRYNQKLNDSRESVLNTEILEVIRKWLLNHILIEDQKYSVFAKGVGGGRNKLVPTPRGTGSTCTPANRINHCSVDVDFPGQRSVRS